jgi:hypothetical protein
MGNAVISTGDAVVQSPIERWHVRYPAGTRTITLCRKSECKPLICMALPTGSSPSFQIENMMSMAVAACRGTTWFVELQQCDNVKILVDADLR